MPDTATTLWEIEAIKQLKARYCRYLDTKQWDDWRTLFTDDFVSRIPFDPASARVPACNIAVGIKHIDGVIGNAAHQKLEFARVF